MEMNLGMSYVSTGMLRILFRFKGVWGPQRGKMAVLQNKQKVGLHRKLQGNFDKVIP